jgi:lipoyl-dependent peroxiredoxin
MKRHATAVWQGTGKEGTGSLTTQSTVLDQTQYSFNTRFGEGKGTNPEELIAAAHAGCLAMKLSFVLNAAGFTATELSVTATVNLNLQAGIVDHIQLDLTANVPGISAEKFDECAADAKANCPISKLMNAEISMNITLV